MRKGTQNYAKNLGKVTYRMCATLWKFRPKIYVGQRKITRKVTETYVKNMRKVMKNYANKCK